MCKGPAKISGPIGSGICFGWVLPSEANVEILPLQRHKCELLLHIRLSLVCGMGRGPIAFGATAEKRSAKDPNSAERKNFV